MKKPKQKDSLQPKEQLSSPNPLQKKCLKTPLSIFPHVQLPDFTFSTDQQHLLPIIKQIPYSPQKQAIRSRSISPKKRTHNKSSNILQLQQTQLNVLFSQPIYVCSKRLSKGSNKNFCNIKIFPQESHSHQPINDEKQNFLNDLNHEQNLSFESRFQSGNLAMSTKSKLVQNQYYLLLTKDYNTARCTQWFFFRTINKQSAKCTFHILNFFKNYSSFQQGMQLCVSSQSSNYVWTRGGENIMYRKTNIKSDQRHLYCLTFSYDFTNAKDVTYFSYSYPYTYSRLDKLLFSLEDPYQSILKRRSIGSSLGGNSIDMVTITNFKTSSQAKKLILITGRVHPGETPSSFVMQGIISKLIYQQMQNAREHFIFKLIPMLNPDGVINGNYRCSLSGYDMNRIWNNCDKDKFPQIYCIKKMMQGSKKPFLFIDLHAHSKKKGAFMYGCSIKNNPFLCREIPFLLWKNINEFNYYQCSFSTHSKQRQGTARMTMFREFGVTLSYTMQNSFCGPLKVRSHFTVDNLQKIGENLVVTLEKYYGRRRKQNENDNEILQQLYQNKDLLKVGQGQDNDSSSDSELQDEFQVDIEDNKKSKPRLEKFRPRSKLNCQSINDTSIKTPREKFNNNFLLTRTTSIREKASSELKIHAKKVNAQQIPKISLQLEDYMKGSEELRPDSIDPFKEEKASLSKEDEFLLSRKVMPALRYSQDQVNNLTNLFLPSVTSSAYRKYNKPKTINKGLVHVGRKFLQNAGYLKDEIKSTLNKKIEWKSSGKTFLS